MLEVRSPYDYSLIESLKLDSMGEMQKKLESALEAFDKNQTQSVDRISQLENFITHLSSEKSELSSLIAREGGKPLKDSTVEVERAIEGVKFIITELRKFSGREIPMGLSNSSRNKKAFTVREPKRLVVAISAFNHPLNLIIHQIVPAVALGCSIIVKPDLRTPLSCIRVVELLWKSGFDKNSCQYLLCENYIAEELVKNKNVEFLSFVGSESVGWHLRSILPKGASCVLEHGGSAPLIVDQTADLEKCIPAVIKGGYYHSGQVCVSVQRLFVHESILEDFKSKLIAATKKLKVGDPNLEETDLGPLIEPSQVERVHSWVKESSGGILLGGEKKSEKEYFPTIILNPNENDKVSKEEIFGPVICLYSFKEIDEAIKRANQVDFAFQASIYSNNYENIMKASSKLKANAVMVNEHTAFRVDWMPFGGYKKSGLGVGGFEESFKDLTNEKIIVFSGVEI